MRLLVHVYALLDLNQTLTNVSKSCEDGGFDESNP